MTAAVLVGQLRARGFRFRINGETLHISPGAQLTDVDRAAVRSQKAGILIVLETELADPAIALVLDVFPAGTVIRCLRCGGARWRPDQRGTGDRCSTCGAWSPCSPPLGTAPSEPMVDGSSGTAPDKSAASPRLSPCFDAGRTRR